MSRGKDQAFVLHVSVYSQDRYVILAVLMKIFNMPILGIKMPIWSTSDFWNPCFRQSVEPILSRFLGSEMCGAGQMSVRSTGPMANMKSTWGPHRQHKHGAARYKFRHRLKGPYQREGKLGNDHVSQLINEVFIYEYGTGSWHKDHPKWIGVNIWCKRLQLLDNHRGQRGFDSTAHREPDNHCACLEPWTN